MKAWPDPPPRLASSTRRKRRDPSLPPDPRGQVLRESPLVPYWRSMGVAVRTAKAEGFRNAIMPLIRYLKRDRGWSYNQIAKEFNARGMKTQRGKAWSGCTVQALLKNHPV